MKPTLNPHTMAELAQMQQRFAELYWAFPGLISVTSEGVHIYMSKLREFASPKEIKQDGSNPNEYYAMIHGTRFYALSTPADPR